MASDLSLRLYRATQRVDYRTDRGSRVSFTVVDTNRHAYFMYPQHTLPS